MLFESFGPFDVDREFFDAPKREFWTEVEGYDPGLSSAIGCYVFCLERGERVLPWYVGKTIASGGFKGEVFQDHKMLHYKNILVEKSGYKPFFMLFPMVTEGWKYSGNRSNGAGVIDWLESTLIGMALAKNPEIANVGKTGFHKNAYVNGVIGTQAPGRRSGAADLARKLFVG